ncbi:unnamed protein product [Rotaria sordida]|uniref:Right handed beta helix domain-containing protein n=1 Tax=Rotaria sordida TaxID=392033 RepID=A0A816E165_9BILA|nr:unnamed protein product [Rotaria sordida]CAF1643986.1 unnamed protein product [Rotaria sordida]
MTFVCDWLSLSLGIQLAVSEAIKSGLHNSVVFGFGTYNLSSEIIVSYANNLTVIGQGIDKTFLIGNSPSSIFSIKSCQGLIITSLSIDFDPLPFTAGYVVNQVEAILRYDPIAMRPAFDPNTYDMYQRPPPNTTTSLVSPGVLRIPLKKPAKFVVQDPIVVRYAFQKHVIASMDAQDLTIQSINIYTSWCMDFAATRTKRLNIIAFNVVPRSERWMSIIMDCMHFTDSREYISVSNSKCSSMGDDGLNVHAMYFIVKKIINSTALIVQTLSWPYILDVGIGTHLEFSSNQQPFTPHAKGAVASTKIYDSLSQLYTFDSPLDVTVNDYVVVSDAPQLTIRNFTIENNRACGILLETRNVNVKQSVFNRTSGPAILFQPSLHWDEGPYAINVTLSENLFVNNNEGLALPTIKNVQITSSTFLIGNYNQGVIQSYNGNNIAFYGNYIATNHSGPLISICNTRNITANNNTVVNNLTKINQYYTLDQNNPCLTNLSSLIDLPPSAFNSSFPPPVTLPKLLIEDNQYYFMKKKVNDENN